MNREIEFRGKLSHSCEWFFGSLLKIDSKYHIVTESDMYEDGHHICQESDTPTWIDPDTIGQFTELVDKNGVKIFEGDIVLWDRDQKMYVVVFRNGMYYASVEECNPHIYGGFPLWYLCEQEQQCTIAGNIYDNPELLATK